MKKSTKYFILMLLCVITLATLYGPLAALLGFLIWVVSCGGVLYYLIEEGKYERVD